MKVRIVYSLKPDKFLNLYMKDHKRKSSYKSLDLKDKEPNFKSLIWAQTKDKYAFLV